MECSKLFKTGWGITAKEWFPPTPALYISGEFERPEVQFLRSCPLSNAYLGHRRIPNQLELCRSCVGAAGSPECVLWVMLGMHQ